jgi:hypothetical protein
MKELLDKISSYNLFNYLLPGILFVAILEKFTSYSIKQDNLVVGVFVYYFIGLVVSRVGSLIIEPFLKWTGFVKFAEYSDYVAAVKLDPKIDMFSESNNMFRTFIALFFVLLLVKSYGQVLRAAPFLIDREPFLLVLLLLVMFVCAYKKQTAFIVKRIKTTKV